MQKCQDIRNMDTCDHFKSYTAIENACTADELTGDKALYESVFNISTPKLSCPVKAGIYQIKNYPFVTRNNHLMVSESKISTSVFGYTLRLDGYSEDEKIMCIEAYMQLVYSRNQLGKDNGSEDNDSAEDKLAEDDNPDDNNADDEDDDSKANGKDKDETGTEDSKDDDNGSNADAVEDENNSKVNDDKANNADSNADDDKAYDGDSDSDGTQPKELSKTEGANADDGDSDDLTPNNEDDDTTGDENVGHDEGDENE